MHILIKVEFLLSSGLPIKTLREGKILNQNKNACNNKGPI
ncbi:unnamed protein product [Paramecium pentaurelia]|uniref:Uncharacterized protein n=1 Tax=Paramecium pentaurelia TaxID=43138 RepID=A0A8S1WKS9_9CILI|nr:unnamed protein product [Paramecium pentaurelia]